MTWIFFIICSDFNTMGWWVWFGLSLIVGPSCDFATIVVYVEKFCDLPTIKKKKPGEFFFWPFDFAEKNFMKKFTVKLNKIDEMEK